MVGLAVGGDTQGQGQREAQGDPDTQGQGHGGPDTQTHRDMSERASVSSESLKLKGTRPTVQLCQAQSIK